MIDNELKEQIISRFIKTASGRQRLAASMIQPLRRRRDYSSVGRKAFWVDILPDGALPIYDKDASVTAYVVGEEGANIIAVQKPKRVMFPLFEIAANPEVQLTEVKARRFDLIERAVDLGKAEIQAEEDRKVFATMNAVASDATTPNPAITVTGNLTSNVMIDAMANIQRSDIRLANIFMNAKDYSDIMKWDRDVLDPVTQADLLKTGLMAKLWGANVIVSRIVAEGTVYMCGEPEFLGRIPVRTELTVLSADDPKNRLIGFSMFENLGIGAFNPSAIVKILITRV